MLRLTKDNGSSRSNILGLRYTLSDHNRRCETKAKPYTPNRLVSDPHVGPRVYLQGRQHPPRDCGDDRANNQEWVKESDGSNSDAHDDLC